MRYLMVYSDVSNQKLDKLFQDQNIFHIADGFNWVLVEADFTPGELQRFIWDNIPWAYCEVEEPDYEAIELHL